MNKSRPIRRNYFEVIFVDDTEIDKQIGLKDRFESARDVQDEFSYEVIVLSNLQDALIALLFNPNIQACVIRSGISFNSNNSLSEISSFISGLSSLKVKEKTKMDLGHSLGEVIKTLRPQLDLFYIADTAVAELEPKTLSCFNRIFYRTEDLQEIHLSILHA